MVVSERAASADARGAAGARVTWAMRLSRPGAHAACIVARVLTVGRFVPVGGSLRGDGIQQNSTAVLGNPRRPERKMKVLCICSFLCFVCLIMSPTPRAFGLHASHAATSNLHASKKWRGRNAQIWFASCSARRRSRTMAQPSVEAAVPHVDLVVNE